MKFLIDTLKTFTKFELALWLGSLALIISSFFLTGNDDYLVLTASLVGATGADSRFQRKRSGTGPHRGFRRLLRHHFLSFPLLWRDDYLPGYVCAHRRCFRRHVAAPFLQGKGRESQFAEPKGVPRSVRRGTDCFFRLFLYLRAFHTSRLIVSTVSVLTSFLASYLTMRRSAYYAVAYAANDVVLVALWILASLNEVRYLPMVICFLVFLANDLYGFFNWSRTGKRQSKESNASQRQA